MVLDNSILVTIMAEAMVEENSKKEKADKLSKRKLYAEGGEYLKALALAAPAVFISGPPPPPQHPNQLFPEACLAW